MTSRLRARHCEIDQGRRNFLVAGLTATGGFLLGIPSLNLLAAPSVTPPTRISNANNARTREWWRRSFLAPRAGPRVGGDGSLQKPNAFPVPKGSNRRANVSGADYQLIN